MNDNESKNSLSTTLMEKLKKRTKFMFSMWNIIEIKILNSLCCCCKTKHKEKL